MPLPKLQLRKESGAKKNPKVGPKEYRHTTLLKLLTGFLILSLSVIFLGSIWFVFDKVKTTIHGVNTIMQLQSELTFEPLNFDNLDNVEKNWQEKHATSTLTIHRDPFHEAPVIVEIVEETNDTTIDENKIEE